MQQHVGFVQVGPHGALHRELQTLQIEKFTRVGDGLALHLHMALLDQACAHAAGAKALAEQDVFQAHGFERFGFHGA